MRLLEGDELLCVLERRLRIVRRDRAGDDDEPRILAADGARKVGSRLCDCVVDSVVAAELLNKVCRRYQCTNAANAQIVEVFGCDAIFLLLTGG